MDIDQYRMSRLQASEYLHRCTCQLFLNSNNKPVSRGTGVCVKLFGKYFILTAAHVVEGYEGPLYIKCKKGLLAFDHDCVCNNVDMRDEDRLDFAILELPQKTIEELDGFYDFIASEQLGVNHALELTPHYVAYGYPAAKTKLVHGTRSIDDQPNFIAVAPCTTTDYSHFGCNPSNNIIVKYPQKNMISVETQKKGTGPGLHGMSGGGLWYVPQKENLNPRSILLVGILIEWPTKNRTKVIATRIDVITEILRLVHGLPLVSSILTTHVIS